MPTLLGFLIVSTPLVVIAILAGWQREALGALAGNILLCLEIICVLAGAVLIRWLKAGRAIAAAVLSLLLAAVLFAYIGWASHPSQLISRANNRVFDAELAIADYHVDIRSGVRRIDDGHAERIKRMRSRLAAARSERDAAEIRYEAFLDSPTDAIVSWLFWLLSVVCVVAAIGLPRIARQRSQPYSSI